MSNQGRLCDTCCAATSILYCHADMAYLCSACDSAVHSTNSMITWHKRVCLCTECMYAPAAFACRNDAASLCINCDAEVHSASMLAARHEKVPVSPMCCFLSSLSNIETEVVDDGEKEASSWLLDEPEGDEGASNNEASLIEADRYLNLANYNQFNETHYQYQYNPDLFISIWGDSNTESENIVPLKLEETSEQRRQQQQNLENFYMEMEKNMPKIGSFQSPSSNQSAIVPFLDAETAQDSTMSTISSTYSRVPQGTLGLHLTPNLPVGPAVTPMSREARVLRYREKKKARKFEKTIRYASRKAYAEARPRLKGRFAKKIEIENTDGIVPSL